MTSISKPILIILLLVTSCSVFSQKTELDSTITIACTFADEIKAGYPGGLTTWQKHVLLHINPAIAKRKGAPAGSYLVDVAFLITKDGSVDSVKALSTNGYGIEREVVKAIQKVPKWSPAFKNGRNVPEWKCHTITFIVPK